jgi:hypothetical protein
MTEAIRRFNAHLPEENAPGKTDHFDKSVDLFAYVFFVLRPAKKKRRPPEVPDEVKRERMQERGSERAWDHVLFHHLGHQASTQA